MVRIFNLQGAIVAIAILAPTVYPLPSPLLAQSNGTVRRPTLQIGSEGETVKELQGVLKLMGYYTGQVDGIYREATANALARFQEDAGIRSDGVAGDDTWNRLFPGFGTPPRGAIAPADPSPSGYPLLRKGMDGPLVTQLQGRLRELGFFEGTATGYFGDRTEAAVKAAQRRFNLSPDGIVGEATWNALDF
ncbi:peptidoglycan-binding protein [Oxynema sp. CENA135]|uniref:peptidoglycan-binding domain-containing protein n=1 Tax=Oxynema sp. CENA135 TaxID=984206 RepID=UPI00351C9F7E